MVDRRVEPWAADTSGDRDLEAAVFDREFDSQWRRTSYSGITASAHEGFHEAAAGERVGSEEEEGLLTDENDLAVGIAESSEETSSRASAFGDAWRRRGRVVRALGVRGDGLRFSGPRF